MTVSTFSAAVHITPSTLTFFSEHVTIIQVYVTLAVIKTFYTHGRRKAKKLKDGDIKEEATDDILFDECVSSSRPDYLALNLFQSIPYRQILHSSRHIEHRRISPSIVSGAIRVP
jgi:hypothetical protein